jgi:hypothetical protein
MVKCLVRASNLAILKYQVVGEQCDWHKVCARIIYQGDVIKDTGVRDTTGYVEFEFEPSWYIAGWLSCEREKKKRRV